MGVKLKPRESSFPYRFGYERQFSIERIKVKIPVTDKLVLIELIDISNLDISDLTCLYCL